MRKILYILLIPVLLLACSKDEKTIDYDIAKPVISGLSNTADAFGPGGSTILSGNLSDETGLKSYNLKYAAWGLDTTVSVSGKSAAINFTLPIPANADFSIRNTVEVSVKDTRHNTAVFYYTLNPGTDSSAPTATAGTAEIKAFPGFPLVMNIVVSDNLGLTDLKLVSEELSLNAAATANGSATYTFVLGGAGLAVSIPSSGFAAGEHVLKLSATDVAGNTSVTNIKYTVADAPAYETVGIIGSATANGWDASSALALKDPADPYNWIGMYNLKVGEVKFRANNAWDVNWGGPAFASGTGEQGGPNIAVAEAGEYLITFNSRSGEYTFTKPAVYQTVGVIGAATAKGWDGSSAMTQNPANKHHWKGVFMFTAGEMKFRANDAWDVNWGGNGLSGYGVPGGPNIAVQAGYHIAEINSATGKYTLTLVANPKEYATVGIIGSGTSKGWDASTAMVQDATNKHLWTLTATLTAGEMKFRADNDWAVNWGSDTANSGFASQNGPNIPVAAGTYKITFNDLSGIYTLVKQ